MADEGNTGRARGPYGKSAERRRQIVDGALAIFARDGVDAGSYRTVAAAVGVSHAALRYYFPSREELLVAVYAAHEHREDEDEWLGEDLSPVAAMQASATRNRQVPGLVRLYAALVADAVQEGHPTTRGFVTRRFESVRRQLGRRVADAQAAGRLRADVDASDVAALVVAVSDGLQVQWLLDPDAVSVEDALAVLETAVSRPGRPDGTDGTDGGDGTGGTHGTVDGDGTSRHPGDVDAARDGTSPASRRGAERRTQILDRMIRMVAAHGVDASSMRSVAEALGVSHTALRHYFSSRDELLVAVYEEHEARETSGTEDDGPAVVRMRRSATRNRAVPGLVELYTTLAADALQGSHPVAHAFVADRFRWLRDGMTRLVERDQAAGVVRGDLDARAVAALLIAASDGLQVQWLLDPAVDTERVLGLFGRLVAAPTVPGVAGRGEGRTPQGPALASGG